MRFLLFAVFFTASAFSLLGQQTTGLFEYDAQAAEGYTLFSPLLAGSNQYLLNNCGEVVHTWNSPVTSPANSMYLLEDGTMLYPARADTANNNPITGGGGGERIIRKDWDGTILWDYIYYDETKKLHHDIELLPNGNVLAIAWVLIDSVDCVAAGRNPERLSRSVLWTERVIEVEPTGPTTGNIVWQWDLWDHLVQDFDPVRDNYAVVGDHPELLDINWLNTFESDSSRHDFVHLNSIDYNAELDQIVLSSQVHSEIWIIDHSTNTQEAAGHTGGDYGKGGDFLYRWGNPQVYDRGSANDQMLWRQHDANWIEDGLLDAGGIMIYNNGLNRSPGYSEIDVVDPPQITPGVYDLSVGEAYGPEATTWKYHAEDSVSFYSYFISGARRLENGNTMICEGESGRFFEVTHDGEVVWDYVNPVEQWSTLSSTGIIPIANGSYQSNMVFRAQKYPANFPGFNGRDLSTGVQLEANPILGSCIVGVDDLNESETVSLYPNPTDGFITLENLNGANLTIYNSSGQLLLEQDVNSNKFSVDLEGQSSGLYAIHIDFNGKRISSKLMVQ